MFPHTNGFVHRSIGLSYTNHLPHLHQPPHTGGWLYYGNKIYAYICISAQKSVTLQQISEKEQNMLTLDLLKQMNLLDYLMHIINSKIKLGTKEIYEVSTCI